MDPKFAALSTYVHKKQNVLDLHDCVKNVYTSLKVNIN